MADEQCIFCMIAQNKIQSAKVYDDDSCIAFLDIKPASKGHIQIISKAHVPLMIEVDEAVRQKIFSLALSIGQNLIKKLGSTGVSYIINEGAGAGQRVAHASMHIIPRYEDDGINVNWPDKQLSQEELSEYINDVFSAISGKAPEPKGEMPKAEPKADEKIKKPEEEIKLKPRIPKYW